MAGAADDPGGDAARADFAAAARAFVDLVAGLDEADWAGAGLGVWSVRDLVGHTSRALLTVESYLSAETDPAAPHVVGTAAYFAASRRALADADAVAERGRQAGAALGERPVAAVAELADRVTRLVAATPDDAPVATPVGTMSLRDYLPARTFELTVHSLDLATAVGAEPPVGLSAPIAAGLRLVAELAADAAGDPGTARTALLALTGRARLPEGFSVL